MKPDYIIEPAEAERQYQETKRKEKRNILILIILFIIGIWLLMSFISSDNSGTDCYVDYGGLGGGMVEICK